MFPSGFVCIICNRECDHTTYGICDKCFNKLPFIEKPCVKCGRESKTVRCVSCLGHKRNFDFARSVFNYEGRMRELYLSYKYDEDTYLAAQFASFLINAYRGLGIHCDGVCGVPSYQKRKSKYLNHSELLAKTVADALGLPIVDGLRKKKVPKQVGLTGDERRKNAIGAYYVEGDEFKGKTMLVVDDVFTTGSTVDSVSATLKRAGALKVYCLTLFSVGEEDATKTTD